MNNLDDLILLQTLIRIYKSCDSAHEISVMAKISGISKGLMVPEMLEKNIIETEEAIDMTTELIFCILSISTWQQKKREEAFKIMDSNKDIEYISNRLIELSKEEINEEPESTE